MRSPLLILSLSFFAGVAVATGFASPWVEAGAALAATVVATIAALRSGKGGAALAVVAAGLFALGLARADDGPPSPGAVAAFTGREVMVVGVVESDPVVRGAGQDVRLAVESVSLGAERATPGIDVLLRAGPGVALVYGDRVQALAGLQAVRSQGDGDFEDYLAERGIAATGFAREVSILEHGAGNPLRAGLSSARATLDGGLARSLEEPLAGLSQGIVTGRRGALQPGLRDDLKATGLSHLVVISGSNVTLLAVLVVAGSAWAVGRRRAIWLAIVVVGLYTAFVGADAPVVRAAIMGTLLLLAGASGRRGAAEPAIALAAALMVAIQPGTIDDLSFQLSFAATAALAAVAEPARLRTMSALGLDLLERTPGVRLQLALLETAIMTVAAVAATLPLIALHFGRISLVALPANLLVAPLFTLIFLGSLATSLAGAIGGGLGQATGWLLAWLPLSWFVAVAEGAASLPFASAQIDGFGLTHAVVLYAAITGVAVWLRRGGTRRRRERDRGRDREDDPTRAARALRALEFPTALAALGVLLAANVVVWGALAWNEGDTLDTYVLDVGQGDAILAVAPGGATLLVDGGPDGQLLLAELAEALPAGRRRIDVVVATHPQADHVSGLFAVLERYRVGTLLVPPLHDTTELGRQLRAAAEAQGIPVRTVTAGMLLVLGDEVEADVLAPAAGEDFGDDLNAAGIVLRLRHGSVALLLTADIGVEEELRLARGPWDLRSQGLKVAHHGSKTSTSDLLLRRVSPEVSAISLGAGNSFGHPHPGVLERLGVGAVLRTDVDGRVRLRSDGETLRYDAGR